MALADCLVPHKARPPGRMNWIGRCQNGLIWCSCPGIASQGEERHQVQKDVERNIIREAPEVLRQPHDFARLMHV